MNPDAVSTAVTREASLRSSRILRCKRPKGPAALAGDRTDRAASAGGVLIAGELPGPQRDDPPVQRPLHVLAPWVEALRPADPEPARRLVDVPVERDRGLGAADGLPDQIR